MALRAKPRTKRGVKRIVDERSLAAAVECARIADARRGEEIMVLDIERLIFVTDYFVIASASNKRQIQAIAQETREHLRKAGYTDVRLEGYEGASWVLVDCGPVVAHIFREDLRPHYDLELLWGDAPRIDWQKQEK